jgi:hypothetical protein
MHAMMPRLNEGFDKHLDPFIKLCHIKNHKPLSALLVTTMWSKSVRSEEFGHKDIKEDLEKHFKRISADIRKIPISMRFNNGDNESACVAINALLKDITGAKKNHAE